MINRVVLQGRLVSEPELRRTQTGTPVCSVTVAWSEKYKETERQLFMDCVAWSGLAEFLSKHFRKGQELAVEGFLTTRKWEDKQGQKRSSTECILDKVHFCGPKVQADPFAGEGVLVDVDEDLPFDF